MRTEVGCGLQADTRAEAIDKVLGNHGVDGAYVNLRRLACLDEVLHERLQAYHNVLEALDLRDMVNKTVHGLFALGEADAPILAPEGLVTHGGTLFAHFTLLAAEEVVRQLVEGIVGKARGTYDDGLLHEVNQLQLGYHVINGKHPRRVGQLRELLLYAERLYPVDAALLRNGELTALNLVRGVGQYVDVATEAEVQLVVGHIVQVNALVTLHIDGVLNIVAVEVDGGLADGRRHGVLQNAYLVVVDVDVGKEILGHHADNVARLEQVAHACRLLSLDDGPLSVRVAAVNLLRHRLIDRKWQYEFVVVGAHLHLVLHPLGFEEMVVLNG